jgi:hypothetical protein
MARRPLQGMVARSADAGNGVVPRLRGLLRRALTRLRPAPPSPGEGRAASASEQGRDAILLSFPIRGEALLVRLVAALRERLRSGMSGDDPFILTISRSPRLRLSIDRAAYVEFRAESASFHLTIEAAPESRVTLETTDFDTLVKFAMQYVAGDHRDLRTLEVAS